MDIRTGTELILTYSHSSGVRFLATVACLAGMATAGASPALAQATGRAQAGVAAAVRGDVRLLTKVARSSGEPSASRAVGQVIASGDRIFLGDRIETGPRAGLQIMLLDETIFTIGPNAAMVIDTFVYDPESDRGVVSASIVKGAFRFVSGRIAKQNPADMNLRVGVATMGIRGTSAAGFVNEGSGDADEPGGVNVVLLGPGDNNNADERPGRITLGNGGSSVEISRPGFGSSIVGADGTPTPPARLSLQQINAITAGLTAGDRESGDDSAGGGGSNGGGQGGGNSSDSGAGSSDDDGGGGSATGEGGGAGATSSGASGESQPVSGGNVNSLSGQSIGAGAGNAISTNIVTAVTQTAEQQLENAAESTGETLSTIASFDDLRAIESGVAAFSMTDVALTGGGTGKYDAAFLINFVSRTLNVAIGNVQYQWAGEEDTRSFVYSDTLGYGTASGPTSTVHSSDADPTNRFTLSIDGGGEVDVGDGCNGCEGGGVNIDIVRVEHEILNNVEAGQVAGAAHLAVKITNGENGRTLAGEDTASRF